MYHMTWWLRYFRLISGVLLLITLCLGKKKLVSTSPTGMSAVFNGNDVALLTYRLRLLLPAVSVGRALVDGRLIAEAACYPLAGHIAGVHPSVFQVYLAQCQRAWEEAVMHLRNPASEITASALARVKNIVLEWFAERRHMIDKLLVDVDGLDEIPRHVRRQEREVKELFSLHESFLANTPSWNGSWPANKNLVSPPDALLQRAYWS